jgi:aspartyl-tRNA(Asn)/glutamyl-tRNA(Gln) amidotransferase subunit C
MATIPRDEVLRLARLARLDLTEAEIDRFTRQLGDILEFVRQVNAVDTLSVETLALSPEQQDSDRLRDDERQPSLERDAVLDLAPKADRAAGLFVVPPVLSE